MSEWKKDISAIIVLILCFLSVCLGFMTGMKSKKAINLEPGHYVVIGFKNGNEAASFYSAMREGRNDTAFPYRRVVLVERTEPVTEFVPPGIQK